MTATGTIAAVDCPMGAELRFHPLQGPKRGAPEWAPLFIVWCQRLW